MIEGIALVSIYIPEYDVWNWLSIYKIQLNYVIKKAPAGAYRPYLSDIYETPRNLTINILY